MTVCCIDSSHSQSLVDTVRAMRQRESQYAPADYMYQSDPQPPGALPLDEECRAKMSLWCTQIVDHCRFSKETCVIAMNSLDRFVSVTPMARLDRSAFQLATIASLYTAIKVHEPQAIAVASMADLTRGVYSEQQIEAMERVMLDTNRWLVHPPTTFAYSHLFCEIISRADPEYDCDMLHDLARLQLEASIHNYDIAISRPSEVAFAAVMNAAEGMALYSPIFLQDIEDLLCSVAKIDASSSSIHSIEKTLYEGIVGIHTPGPVCDYGSGCGAKCEPADRPKSPRSVSAVKGHQ